MEVSWRYSCSQDKLEKVLMLILVVMLLMMRIIMILAMTFI